MTRTSILDGVEIKHITACIGGMHGDTTPGTPNFATLQGTRHHGTEVNVQGIVPTDGFFRNLRVKTDGALGAGKTLATFLRVNGVSSALTCSITGAAATTGSDLVNVISVSAGDSVCYYMTNTAASNAVTVDCGCEFVTR